MFQHIEDQQRHEQMLAERDAFSPTGHAGTPGPKGQGELVLGVNCEAHTPPKPRLTHFAEVCQECRHIMDEVNAAMLGRRGNCEGCGVECDLRLTKITRFNAEHGRWFCQGTPIINGEPSDVTGPSVRAQR